MRGSTHSKLQGFCCGASVVEIEVREVHPVVLVAKDFAGGMSVKEECDDSVADAVDRKWLLAKDEPDRGRSFLGTIMDGCVLLLPALDPDDSDGCPGSGTCGT
jgi:hypothetical protein